MSVIGKDIRTRIQFFNPSTKESKTLTVYGHDFDKIYDNTKYFLEQLITYPEIKILCYGGDTHGKKTIYGRRKDNYRKEPEQTEEYSNSVEES